MCSKLDAQQDCQFLDPCCNWKDEMCNINTANCNLPTNDMEDMFNDWAESFMNDDGSNDYESDSEDSICP